MDIWMWVAIAAGLGLLGAALCYFAPARTTIVIDTGASTARADMRLLGGLGPTMSSWALPASEAGNPLAIFSDTARISHALITPGLADTASHAVHSLFQNKVRLARLELGLNFADTARSLVVQTAVAAAFATAPAHIRDVIVVTKCEPPGAELRGRIEVDASPARLSSIWSRFRNSRPVREFRKRLKRKPKPEKRPVREVRAS
jgi:hypothetical protein